MNPRLYRLTELDQRIDEALRTRRARPLELTRLVSMKLRVKQLIRRIARKTASA